MVGVVAYTPGAGPRPGTASGPPSRPSPVRRVDLSPAAALEVPSVLAARPETVAAAPDGRDAVAVAEGRVDTMGSSQVAGATGRPPAPSLVAGRPLVRPGQAVVDAPPRPARPPDAVGVQGRVGGHAAAPQDGREVTPRRDAGVAGVPVEMVAAAP